MFFIMEILITLAVVVVIINGIIVCAEIEKAFFKRSSFVIKGNYGRKKGFFEKLLSGLGF